LPHSTSAPSCASGQTYEQLTYDPAGSVTAKRNRSGISLAFVFDDLNRETTRTVPDNPAVAGNLARTLTTSYDLAGRSWDATADSQTLSQRYDAAGRLDYVDDSYLGASNNRVNPGYDAAGNRTSLVYPGGTSVAFTFDALNRLDTVTEGGVTLADYDWDTLSRRDLVRLDNNAFSSDLGYEADDDLSSIVHTGPAPLTFTLARNASSQITGLTASDGAFLARPAATLSQAYSPNRLNQYSSVAGTAQVYDANGNLTGDGTYTFTYDEENRLRTASGAGYTSTYEYDPLGRRRAKIVNGVTTRYASDGAEEIEERDASQVVLRKYVYGQGIDDRIAMLDATCAGGGRCFYLTNWQGSATTLVNQDGTLNAVYHYGPYGEGTNWTPSDALTGNPFRYTGRRVDPETGLYYYRARYYSPRTGRFLQTDPVGTKDDLNLYAFVGNDPLNRVDPSGLGCTGSRIENNNGSCASTGGFTTGTSGAAQGLMRQRAAETTLHLIQAAAIRLAGNDPAPGIPITPNPSDPVGTLLEAVRQAQRDVTIQHPAWLRGILIHLRFAQYVRQLGGEFDAEVSYYNKAPIRYGFLGSIRADAIYGPRARPFIAFELKTGGAKLQNSERTAYFENLPTGTELMEIRELGGDQY